jgi:hypothetical protein
MMAAGDPGAGVDGDGTGGEDILPAPFRRALRVLALERMGQVHCPMALGQILLMQRFNPDEVVLEERDERGGKGRETVLISLAGADCELLHGKVNVLDAEPDGFHNPQAAAVEQFGHQLRGALHECEDGSDFVPGHDHGDVDLLVGAHGVNAVVQGLVEDALVEKDEGMHGLVLRGGGDLALQGEMREERLDLGFGGDEVGAGPQAVEPGEAADPFDIGTLRVDGIMLEPEDPPGLLDQHPWWTVGCVDVGHKNLCTSTIESLIIGQRQKCLNIPGLQTLS